VGRRLEVDSLGQVRTGQVEANIAEVGPEPRRTESWWRRDGIKEADRYGSSDGCGGNYRDRGAG